MTQLAGYPPLGAVVLAVVGQLPVSHLRPALRTDGPPQLTAVPHVVTEFSWQ